MDIRDKLVEALKETIIMESNDAVRYSAWIDDNSLFYEKFKDDPDLPTLRDKIQKIIKLMNSFQTKEEVDAFMDKDIENEIWEML
jgi:hypothetical protein